MLNRFEFEGYQQHRPTHHAYKDPYDAYKKVMEFGLMGETKDTPKEAGSRSFQLTVFRDRGQMEKKLYRFKIDGEIVFPSVEHLVDALDAAGFRCDTGDTNAAGDTVWIPPDKSRFRESVTLFDDNATFEGNGK